MIEHDRTMFGMSSDVFSFTWQCQLYGLSYLVHAWWTPVFLRPWSSFFVEHNLCACRQGTHCNKGKSGVLQLSAIQPFDRWLAMSWVGFQIWGRVIFQTRWGGIPRASSNALTMQQKTFLSRFNTVYNCIWMLNYFFLSARSGLETCCGRSQWTKLSLLSMIYL